jgi:hypothetical protein
MIDRFMLPQGYFSHGLPAVRYLEFLEKGGIEDLQIAWPEPLQLQKAASHLIVSIHKLLTTWFQQDAETTP